MKKVFSLNFISSYLPLKLEWQANIQIREKEKKMEVGPKDKGRAVFRSDLKQVNEEIVKVV